MDRDNVIELSDHLPEVELHVEDLAAPAEQVFVDETRVIVRTGALRGVAMTPLGAKELAVRLIEAAYKVEQG